MSLDNPAIVSRIRSRGLGHWPSERDYAMRLLVLTLPKSLYPRMSPEKLRSSRWTLQDYRPPQMACMFW